MNFDTYLLTAPRPESTLALTERSMSDAGFPIWELFDGTAPEDMIPSPHTNVLANRSLLEYALHDETGNEAVMVVEDDVIWRPNVYDYLCEVEWPDDLDKIAACSPYCCLAYEDAKNKGISGPWHVEDRGHYLSGAQVMVYPKCNLPSLIEWLYRDDAIHGIDYELGLWARERGLQTWFHMPSLAQHIGIGNSAVGNVDCGTIYRSSMELPDEDDPSCA